MVESTIITLRGVIHAFKSVPTIHFRLMDVFQLESHKRKQTPIIVTSDMLNMGLDATKPALRVCEQQRCRSACATAQFPSWNVSYVNLLRPAWSGSTLFAYGIMIRYDPTLVDLTSNFFVLCLFDLIFNIPSTIFQLNRDRSSRVDLLLS